MLDAHTTEVGTAAFANFVQPLECIGTQGVVLSGVEHKETLAKVDWHQFGGDQAAGVHECGRWLWALPSWAEETQVGWPVLSTATQVVVDFVTNLHRKVKEADCEWLA